MTVDEIRREYESTGRLSAIATEALGQLLTSEDPSEAITAVGDLRLTDFADNVAEALKSVDPMIRWNAVSVLCCRLRSTKHGERVLAHTSLDEDEMVRGASLTGLGVLIKLVPPGLQREMVAKLLEVFSNEQELVEMRGAAYEGMLEALEVPITERPSAARLIDMDADVKEELVDEFKRTWLIPH